MQQRTKGESTCKNHPQIYGIYFLIDQPWTKFCSECALNVALCGKQIDKQLTHLEFENKSKLLRVKENLKQMMEKVQNGRKELGELAEMFQSACHSEMEKSIRWFEKYVEELCLIRDAVLQIFNHNFSKSHLFFQRQTKVILSEIQLKKSVEYIQTNFANLVEGKAGKSLEVKIEEWNKLLDQTGKSLPLPSERESANALISQKTNEINLKFKEIERFGTLNWKNGKKQQKENGAISESTITNVSHATKARATQLKLRSTSKRSEKKSNKEDSIRKVRKSIKDFSNIMSFDSYQL